MSIHPERLMQPIRRQSLPAASCGESDAALLRRFIGTNDQDAFAALVARHSGLVYGVCRRMLRDRGAVEDAFQAVFLVLAKKASTVEPERLVSWIYGVARRVALQAQRTAQRRQQRDRKTELAPVSADPLDELTGRELLLALDEEVEKLPPTYRVPILLCCLQGQSQEEAARQLGCSPGSIKGRLERGRMRLHAQLVRRGLTLGACLAAMEVAGGSARAAVGADLSLRTLRGAINFAQGAESAGADVTAAAVQFAEGALQCGSIAKGKLLLAMIAVSLASLGAAAPMLLQPPAKAAEEVEHDFRASRFDERLLWYSGPKDKGYLTPEAEGLRLRFTEERFPTSGMGAQWRFHADGDLMATGRYEILRVDAPKSGIGIEMYWSLLSPAKDGLSYNYIMTAQGPMLRLTWLVDGNGKRLRKDQKQQKTSLANRGRLRMARQGSTLIASFADADEDTFQEFHRVDIGTAKVNVLRFGGIPGTDKTAALDARLLDMQLQADTLTPAPGGPRPIPTKSAPAVKPVARAVDKAAPPPVADQAAPEIPPAPDPRGLYLMAGIGAFIVALIMLLGLAIVLYRFKRAR
jgi:RNA polymerase sigma factor (sigma-70 family)